MRALSALALGCALLLCGCGGGSGSSLPTTELTADQRAAVEGTGRQLTAFAGVLVTLSGINDARVYPQQDGTVTFGTAPQVTSVRQNGQLTVTFDYGTGTSSPATGGRTVSGQVILSVATTSFAGSIQFNNLVIDGRAVTGTITLSGATAQAGGQAVTITGTANVAVTGVGSIQGPLSITYTQASAFTVASTGLTLTNTNGVGVTVAATGLVIDPVTNHNMVPQAGTLAFGWPAGSAQAVVLTMSFNAQSPSTGTVGVSANGARPIDVTIPGLAG